MIPGFERIVEDRIKKAQFKGDFENLPGSGKPMQWSEDRHIPEDLRLAYKILKNADCLPPEIELKKEILRTEELLAAMPDTAERYRIHKKINYLIMQVNASRNSDARYDMPQQYMTALSNRLTPKKSGTHGR